MAILKFAFSVYTMKYCITVFCVKRLCIMFAWAELSCCIFFFTSFYGDYTDEWLPVVKIFFSFLTLYHFCLFVEKVLVLLNENLYNPNYGYWKCLPWFTAVNPVFPMFFSIPCSELPEYNFQYRNIGTIKSYCNYLKKLRHHGLLHNRWS